MSYPCKPTNWVRPERIEYNNIRLHSVVGHDDAGFTFTAKCAGGVDGVTDVDPINVYIPSSTLICVVSSDDKSKVVKRLQYSEVSEFMWTCVDIYNMRLVYGGEKLATVVYITISDPES